MFKCEYCEKTFNRNYNLYYHQRTAMYCLEIQGKLDETKGHKCEFCNKLFTSNAAVKSHQQSSRTCLKLQGITEKAYECDYCYRTFDRSDTLKRHYVSCPLYKKQRRKEVAEKRRRAREKNKKDKLLNRIDPDSMEEIKKYIEENAGKKLNVQNLAPLTEEDLAQASKNLSIDFIIQGGKGYATFANYYALNGKVVCTDKARNKLQYKDEEGNLVKDYYGSRLTSKFFKSIAARNEEIINTEYSDLQQQVMAIAIAQGAGNSNLTEILTKASTLQTVLADCKQAALGESNMLVRDFINHLSKTL